MSFIRQTLIVLTLSLCAVPMAVQTAAQTIEIDGPDALRQVLRSGAAGAELVLAPGDYGDLELRGADNPALIRSANPARPAVFRGVRANGVEGLTLQDLHLSYDFARGDNIYDRHFDFRNCRDVTLTGNRIEGDRAQGVSAADNGYGFGIAVSVVSCWDVTLENNHFSVFHRGAVISQSEGIAVRGNELTGIRMDGLNFAEVRDVVIEQNHIHSFDRSLNSRDHADFIQFWTNQTSTPSRNIVIRQNVLNSGTGAYTQSIFMRNDLVDRGIAGREMFYRDIVIEENVIINAHLHGITVGETEGLTIQRNTVVQNQSSAGEDPGRPLWVPTIRVAEPSRGVLISGNITATIEGFTGQAGWRVGDNLVAQNRSSLSPGFYGTLFSGADYRQVSSFRIREGSAADVDGLGAAMLRNQ